MNVKLEKQNDEILSTVENHRAEWFFSIDCEELSKPAELSLVVFYMCKPDPVPDVPNQGTVDSVMISGQIVTLRADDEPLGAINWSEVEDALVLLVQDLTGEDNELIAEEILQTVTSYLDERGIEYF